MVTHLPGRWAWGVEWVWVGGYSAAATTILLLNLVLFVSIIRQGLPPSPPSLPRIARFLSFSFRNRYLHYSFNYVVFALSFRWWKMFDNLRECFCVVEIFAVSSSPYFWSSWQNSARARSLVSGWWWGRGVSTSESMTEFLSSVI